MAKAPCYVIHRRVYPDGTEDFRVETGRRLWWRTWIGEYYCIDLEGGYSFSVSKFATRELAEEAARKHWQEYISNLPAMMREEYTFDPEARL